jgi:hypothetical protein
MDIRSLALASAFAAAIGCAQPVLAQSQDQTGVATNRNGSGMNDRMMDHGTMMNETDQGQATTGAKAGNGFTNEDDDNGSADRNWHHPSMGRDMGPMWRHRMMMRAAGGARFHFARGNARIDVRCPADEDVRVCVQAAGKLLDKIAELRGGRGNTTGSAAGEDNGGATNEPGGSASPNDQQNGSPPGRNGPSVPGERM